MRLPIIRWQWTLNSYQSPLGCFLKGKEKKKSFKISASYFSACLTSECEGCYEANKPFFWMVPFMAKSIFFQKVLLLNYIFCKVRGKNSVMYESYGENHHLIQIKISLNLWIFSCPKYFSSLFVEWMISPNKWQKLISKRCQNYYQLHEPHSIKKRVCDPERVIYLTEAMTIFVHFLSFFGRK